MDAGIDRTDIGDIDIDFDESEFVVVSSFGAIGIGFDTAGLGFICIMFGVLGDCICGN